MKIILSRTDNIGDLVLTLPLVELIKQDNPAHKVWFLVRDYAGDILKMAPNVSGVLSWDALSAMPEQAAADEIRAHGFDASFMIHPCQPASKLFKKANIPTRVGTSRRWYHYLHCNKRVPLARSKADRHEALMNTVLLAPIFSGCPIDSLENLPPPMLQQKPICDAIKPYLHATKPVIILHPGSNGHGREWGITRWEALATQLVSKQYQVVVSGSPSEAERFGNATWPAQVVNAMGALPLADFIALIGHAHGLVAASTGPLHVAGALGIHALGLYANSASRGPWRWQPLGEKAEYLSVGPRCEGQCTEGACPCMDAITLSHVLGRILSW